MNNKVLEKMVSELKPETIFPFWHKGQWAVHEILPILLSEYGEADIYISSFSVSEDSLRKLFFLHEEKKMKSLTLLLDNTVRRHKLDMVLFLSEITPLIRFDSVHAKLLMFSNDKVKICLVGSANLNLNARYECGFISTRQDDYSFFFDEYTKAYNNGINYDIE